MIRKRDKQQLVAITGLGMICSLGVTTSQCWESMLQGQSGIRRITRFDPCNCLTQIAGELPEAYYELEKKSFSPRAFRQSILPTRLTLITGRQAIEDSNLELDRIDRNKVAVISGCGGSTFGDEIMYTECSKSGRRRPVLSHGMLNAIAACISIEFGFKGPSFNVATACASGAHAVGLGYDYVRREKGLCIVIGIDTMVVEETINGFNQLMALSEFNECPKKASRPFDRRRSGFVISEGACALVMEPYEHAARRGARIYALMSGYAATSESHNIIAPEPEGKGMARTMELAIENAGIPRQKVGYVNAHGTSTVHNDLAETRAIKRAFGSDAYRLLVNSQKSMIGHSIGAAGAIEAGVTSLSLYHQMVTPTINYEEPDSECDLDYVPNQARRCSSIEAAISNSFGFGGHNCSLVLENHEALLS